MRRLGFELLDVLVFNVLHELAAAKKIVLERPRRLARHNRELIVHGVAPGLRAAVGGIRCVPYWYIIPKFHGIKAAVADVAANRRQCFRKPRLPHEVERFDSLSSEWR